VQIYALSRLEMKAEGALEIGELCSAIFSTPPSREPSQHCKTEVNRYAAPWCV
jgi:hypothetical protein